MRDVTTMTPTTITGSATCPANNAATSPAAALAFAANRIRLQWEGVVRFIAFTFI